MSDLSNLSELIPLFYEKNNFLLNSPYFDTQINTWGYFEFVFNRRDVSDFEAEQSTEYLDWRENKPYKDEQPFRYNALAVELVHKKDGKGLKQGQRWVIFEGDKKDPIQELQGGEFVITSPLTYVGRSRTASNARYAYGYAIDLDGVGMGELADLVHQMKNNVLPMANMIVNSGTGMHVYYLFEKPIALFKNIAEILQKLKMLLIDEVWNPYTSTIDERQKLGIYQGFRVPGTPTKLGGEHKVTAFKNDEQPFWTIEGLNEYITDAKKRLQDWEINLADKGQFKEDRLTKKQAKALYPEWYEKVIVKGDKSRKIWTVKRALYDWFLAKLRGEKDVKEGHRFLCLIALAMYAKKCGVDYEELERDMLSLVPSFEEKTTRDDNHFTDSDVYDALKSFKQDYCFVSRRAIEHITAIRIDKNKRNHQKRENHLEIARAIRDIKVKQRGGGAWDENNGRPKGSIVTAERSAQAQLVRKWRRDNPNNHNKSDCARSLGLSRPTVRKWWNS